MALTGRPPVTPPRHDLLLSVTLLVTGARSADRIALDYGVSRRTVYNWRRDLLAEDTDEGEALRRLAQR